MVHDLSHYFPRFPPLITNAEYFSIVDITRGNPNHSFPVASYMYGVDINVITSDERRVFDQIFEAVRISYVPRY